jgi:plastocyanin
MNKQALVLCSVLSCSALYACGDKEETPVPPTTSSSSSSASSSSGEGGMGGSGGMAGGGGMASGGMGGMAGSTSSGLGGMAGAGGMGGMGGSGGMGGGSNEAAFNGCKLSSADDYTAMNMATIQFAGLSYSPKCMRIKSGTTVTFEGNFGSHPLEGGTVANGIPTSDPASPITKTQSGTSAMFTLNEAGVVPYFCTFHAAANMMGAIFVEP